MKKVIENKIANSNLGGGGKSLLISKDFCHIVKYIDTA